MADPGNGGDPLPSVEARINLALRKTDHGLSVDRAAACVDAVMPIVGMETARLDDELKQARTELGMANATLASIRAIAEAMEGYTGGDPVWWYKDQILATLGSGAACEGGGGRPEVVRKQREDEKVRWGIKLEDVDRG